MPDSAETPSLYSRLQDFLFGRKALQQAGQVGTPAPVSTQPAQDVSYIRKAAEEAAERMKKAKEVSPDKAPPKSFKRGGMVKPGSYGR